MKWISALAFGALLGFVLPTGLDFGSGVWMNSWAGWGTVHPHVNSPGLLFSWPVFIGSAIALRMVFNWHMR